MIVLQNLIDFRSLRSIAVEEQGDEHNNHQPRH